MKVLRARLLLVCTLTLLTGTSVPAQDSDFGDAPDPTYPTLLANNGARHVIISSIVLGSGIDGEQDGQPHPAAVGDDLDGNDDEDGVKFTSRLTPGQWATVEVIASTKGLLNAWIDFEADGGWAEAFDQIFQNRTLNTGVNSLSFRVPLGAKSGTTFARFRFSSAAGLSYVGSAADGEVEDYRVLIQVNPTIKWIQLPDTSPYGIDIRIDDGRWLADDFECSSLGPITDVHLWGSWKSDEVGLINKIHLGIYSDNPSGSNGWSEPNELLWERDFVSGDFQMTAQTKVAGGEFWWDIVGDSLIPGGDEWIWRIDINVPVEDAFMQQGDPCHPVIYWLVVQVDTQSGEFGWKTRRYPEHYMDDAVFDYGSAVPQLWKELRYPQGHPYHYLPNNSIDMAFAITGTKLKRVEHLKWSQPPIEIDPDSTMRTYCGFGEESTDRAFVTDPCEPWRIAADDFRCLGTMPITSVHWWGVFGQYSGVDTPWFEPDAWHICFWSNVAADPGGDPNYSYPDELLWKIVVDANRVDREIVGRNEYDLRDELTFQYFVDLEPHDYFWQAGPLDATEDDVFWISIVGIMNEFTLCPWTWLTRPLPWMDEAVSFELRSEPEPGLVLNPSQITPIDFVTGETGFDLTFELDTDPNWIKWEQPYDSIRHWRHHEDEVSMGTVEPAKWQQLPDPCGWDIGLQNTLTGHADNWMCAETGPVNDIHFWISWMGDEVYDILGIYVQIHGDDPCTYSYSAPGGLRWVQGFSPGEFTISWAGEGDQGFFHPWPELVVRPDHKNYYRIDIEDINDPFVQTEGDIYWLHIGVWSGGMVGLKTSRDHWHDPAVNYNDTFTDWRQLYDPCTGEPLSLAFVTNTPANDVDIASLVADDWKCERVTPVTATVWWGSYIGYRYQACSQEAMNLPVRPDYFLLSIWDDVPANVDLPYSHPGNKIWEHKSYDYDEVFVGYDKHPEQPGAFGHEAVFRYSVKLPRESWFMQEDVDNIYWFSAMAVYETNTPNYDWGWTNHEHEFNDDAVSGRRVYDPFGNPRWVWQELHDQTGQSADMSFILFTDPDPNLGTCWDPGECPCQPQGDATCDGSMNLADLFVLKQHFGKCAPWVNPECCADFTQSGCINLADLFALKAGFGLPCPPGSTGNQTCP
ncbi:MAG: DUF7901 domain-containing protein [Planctomycetota bacterium]|jgi:hypothetical protein